MNTPHFYNPQHRTVPHHFSHIVQWYAYRFNVAMKMKWYAMAHNESHESIYYLQLSRSQEI